MKHRLKFYPEELACLVRVSKNFLFLKSNYCDAIELSIYKIDLFSHSKISIDIISSYESRKIFYLERCMQYTYIFIFGYRFLIFRDVKEDVTVYEVLFRRQEDKDVIVAMFSSSFIENVE